MSLCRSLFREFESTYLKFANYPLLPRAGHGLISALLDNAGPEKSTLKQ